MGNTGEADFTLEERIAHQREEPPVSRVGAEDRGYD